MIENWEIYAVLGFLVMPLVIGWILGCLIPIWWVILLIFSPDKADKFVEHLKKYDSKSSLIQRSTTNPGIGLKIILGGIISV